jgi:hypothetical protein
MLMCFTPLFSLHAQFIYISPVPGSKMHNREAGIILRTGKEVEAASLSASRFTVSGSESGMHITDVKLASDEKTILLHPRTLFSYNETVTVTIADGIENKNGDVVTGTSFEFRVKPAMNKEDSDLFSLPDPSDDEFVRRKISYDHKPQPICTSYPEFILTTVPGAYYDQPFFYENHAPLTPDACSTTNIITSDGDSIYLYNNNYDDFDFKINDNGYLTGFNIIDTCFDMRDSSYNLVKKLFMKNGYHADAHECRIFPDGNYFLLCYDHQTTDMTGYGGLSNAKVTGLVIQELDANDDVIFEWRSWDHFQITDAANDISLTIYLVDYVHGNSLDIDVDGNLILSSRHLDEVTKISLATGEIMWRMGGENNEFTFINDFDSPKPFSHQHHVVRLPNGHLSMLDNGNYQVPQRSSAKEFEIDEVNKTATLVWSYVHPLVDGLDLYSSKQGSVQLLPNGNRFISWGAPAGVDLANFPNFTEVDSNGNIVWEFTFADSFYVNYRAFKFPWDRCNLVQDSALIADSITSNSAGLHWNDHSKFSGFTLDYKECSASSWISIPVDTNFYELTGLNLNTCYDWRVQSICAIYGDSSFTATHQFTTLNPVQVSSIDAAISSFTITPNPALEATVINFSASTGDAATVEIYNSCGKMIDGFKLNTHSGWNKLTVNTTNFSQGVYVVAVSLNGETQRRKLIVQ